MDINLADGVALGIILIWTCIGFSKGMAGQVATLVTGLLTVATAYFAYTPCRHLLAAHVQGSETFIRIAAGVVVIVVPFTLIMLARSLSSRLLQITVVGWVDSIGGAAAGFISSTLFVVAAFFLVNLLPSSYRPQAMGEASFIGRHVVGVEHQLAGSIEKRVENAENALQRARESHTARREKWEQ